MVKITCEITSNRLPTIAARLKPQAAALVGKTAFDVEAGCKARSRVDTGAMRNGWHTNHPPGAYTAYVYNNVEHAVFNEYGTTRMSAQPMAHPAADAARPAFEAGARKLVDL